MYWNFNDIEDVAQEVWAELREQCQRVASRWFYWSFGGYARVGTGFPAGRLVAIGPDQTTRKAIQRIPVDYPFGRGAYYVRVVLQTPVSDYLPLQGVREVYCYGTTYLRALQEADKLLITDGWKLLGSPDLSYVKVPMKGHPNRS